MIYMYNIYILTGMNTKTGDVRDRRQINASHWPPVLTKIVGLNLIYLYYDIKTVTGI